MTKTISKANYTYINVLRIIAAFFVIFNHSGDYGFYLYTFYPCGSVQYWVYLAFSIFSKVSVPLFFLISGALLLNKPDESLKDLWSRRIVKMIIPLVVFSLVYYFYILYWSGEPFSLKRFALTLYSSDWMHHLWYMYAYISFLIVLPFLRSMVKNLSDKYFVYMFILAIFFNGFLVIAEYLLGNRTVTINSYIVPAWIISNTVLYPSIGYYLQHRADYLMTKKNIAVLWGANIAGFVLSSLMNFFKCNVEGVAVKTEIFHGCFVLVNCITVYVTVKYLFMNRKLPAMADRVLKSVGECTFGIYLVHMLLKDRPFIVEMAEKLCAAGVNRMLSALAYCTAIFAVAYVITFVVSKIPVVKKSVGR